MSVKADNVDHQPRSLRDAEARSRRHALLATPHMHQLNLYARDLRVRLRTEVPEFDPLDGGVNARVLFLFEKPGPMTSAHGGKVGSGFISRNNDDPTAEATTTFMTKAGLSRKDTLLWNVVPGWNGTTKVTAKEVAEGAVLAKELVAILPKLEAIVFVGRKAERARKHLKDLPLRFFTSVHPSPKVRATMPDRWATIPSAWKDVADCLAAPTS